MKRIQLLDYGRFFAAISVIAFHYLFNGIHNGKISSISHIPEVIDIVKYAYFGIEFFFMISGYVIFFSAKKQSASQFAVSRATRLYPAFWAAVIFTSSFAIFWGGEHMAVDASLFLTNLTMISPWFGEGFVDGVYWTLLYELKFYALVFALLLFGAQKKLEHIFLAWPLLIVIAKYSDASFLPFSGSYYCYFSAGTILAMMKERKTFLHYFSLLLALFLCISFSIDRVSSIYSLDIIGMIVTLFFVFFIIANSNIGSNLKLPGSRLLGGLSYPVYLIHAHFGYMFISRFATEDNKIAIYLLTVFIVLSSAYLIHTFIEKKYLFFWKKLFNFIIGYPIDFINCKSVSLVTAFKK